MNIRHPKQYIRSSKGIHAANQARDEEAQCQSWGNQQTWNAWGSPVVGDVCKINQWVGTATAQRAWVIRGELSQWV